MKWLISGESSCLASDLVFRLFTLDPMLLTIPKDLGEFVIVHELVHQFVPKRSRLFKLFMHTYLLFGRTRRGGCRSKLGLRENSQMYCHHQQLHSPPGYVSFVAYEQH